jgi:hypothetical protein
MNRTVKDQVVVFGDDTVVFSFGDPRNPNAEWFFGYNQFHGLKYRNVVVRAQGRYLGGRRCFLSRIHQADLVALQLVGVVVTVPFTASSAVKSRHNSTP